MRVRIGTCSSRSVWRKARGSGPGGRGRPTASRIRKSSGVSGSGTGGGSSSSKSSGSRKRARSACSSAGIEPTCWPRVRVISAAFQSPPRARQKTRAGSVGDSAGFCRSAAQGGLGAVEQDADVEPAAEEVGGVGAGEVDEARRLPRGRPSPAAGRCGRRGRASPDASAPPGGSASARRRRRKSARAAGTPSSGCCVDQGARHPRRCRRPRGRGRSRWSRAGAGRRRRGGRRRAGSR